MFAQKFLESEGIAIKLRKSLDYVIYLQQTVERMGNCRGDHILRCIHNRGKDDQGNIENIYLRFCGWSMNFPKLIVLRGLRSSMLGRVYTPIMGYIL